jgi:fructuronate reductase
VVSTLSAVHAGPDLAAWRGYFAQSDVAAMTATITEGGYRRGADGGLDFGAAAVQADVAALRSDPLGAVVTTGPGKFTAGLLARRAAQQAAGGGGPSWGLTFVPCDNVVDSGRLIRTVTSQLAEAVDPTLLAWISGHVAFAATMVDRITPHTTPDDVARAEALTGFHDPAAVVAEPFSEWVIEGEFAAGRPDWEAAGARFTDDLTPYEQRKLWLLNGSHSLMAYAAPPRGCETVGDAIADPVVRAWVEQWWDEACRHIALPAADLTAYRAALVERFSNPAIRHRLDQIAPDGTQKMPMRFGPVLRAELAAGRTPLGAARAVAAWLRHVRGSGPADLADVRADEARVLAAGEWREAAARALAWLGVDSAAAVDAVMAEAAALGA